jgi:hypothetical protein
MHKRILLLLFIPALLTVLLFNCGKKAPPLPPIIIAPDLPASVKVRQFGDLLLLYFQMPVISTDGISPADVEKIEIYRMKEARIVVGEATQTQTAPVQSQTMPQSQTQTQTDTQVQQTQSAIIEETQTAPQTQSATEPQPQSQTQTAAQTQSEPQTQTAPQTQSQPQSQTQTAPQTQTQTQPQTQAAPAPEEEAREVGDKEFEDRAEKIAEIPRNQISGYLRDNWFIFTDKVSSKTGSEDLGNWFFYGVKLYNSRGKSAGFSKIAALFPAEVPKVPPNFTARLQESTIELTWNNVTEDVNGKPIPQENIRYNIYRGTSANWSAEEPLNTEPLTTNSYIDSSFQFGNPYYYFVRALNSKLKRAQGSEPSNVILIYPQDTFPPAAPQELNVVSAREGMVLIWAPNSENDVAGYNIYRSITSGTGYEKINAQLIRETTFTDKKVQKGQQYYYVVSAVDSAPVPNESSHSNEVSEVAKLQ